MKKTTLTLLFLEIYFIINFISVYLSKLDQQRKNTSHIDSLKRRLGSVKFLKMQFSFKIHKLIDFIGLQEKMKDNAKFTNTLNCQVSSIIKRKNLPIAVFGRISKNVGTFSLIITPILPYSQTILLNQKAPSLLELRPYIVWGFELIQMCTISPMRSVLPIRSE